MPVRKSTKSSTARSREAYVDTSALIAFADRSDTYHALFRRMFGNPPPLVTTPLVVAEGHGWFLRRYDTAKGLQFMSMIESMPIIFVDVTADDIASASRILRRYSDQDLTLTDAVGLHVMALRKIKVCWSTDRHLGISKVPLVI
jgi:predicted nucleic acid-binding protein